MKIYQYTRKYKAPKAIVIKIVLFFVLFRVSEVSFAQLGSKHYMPPLKQSSNNGALREQAIYLTTLETATITVNVYKGTATTPWRVTLSNGSPTEIAVAANAAQNIYGDLTNGNNNITLVSDTNTGGEKLYVN